MTTSSNTRLSPDQVRQIAQRHDDVANEITSNQQKLTAEIESLCGANSGEMIRALNQVHSEWNTNTSNVVNNLRQMANNMRQAAQELETQDRDSGQGVIRAGGAIGGGAPAPAPAPAGAVGSFLRG
jgi:WXG100 family type VII secretion target